MSKKGGRKRRAHPDSDDEVDINGVSDDDFDPRELLVVKQIASKQKTQRKQPPAVVKPAPKARKLNGAAAAKEEEAEDGEVGEEDAVDEDGEVDEEDDDDDEVDTVSVQELQRLKRGSKPKREDKVYANNEVSSTTLPLRMHSPS